jgi:hypothetical protein
MSLTLTTRYELERRRRQRLRRQHNKRQAERLIQACRAELQVVREPAVQQLLTKDLKRIRPQLGRIAALAASSPDKALKEARHAHKQLQAAIAGAEARAGKWRKEQAEARTRIAEVQARVKAISAESTSGARALEAELEQLTRLEDEGRHREALAACQALDEQLEKAAEAEFDESIRREVVRALLAALQQQGFVVQGPELKQDKNGAGTVILEGQLPSGRSVRFEVHLDGHMEFDLNGYQDRACAKDVEKIEQVLKESFDVQLGPRQVTWKNPDKISKGARDLPTGGAHAQA